MGNQLTGKHRRQGMEMAPKACFMSHSALTQTFQSKMWNCRQSLLDQPVVVACVALFKVYSRLQLIDPSERLLSPVFRVLSLHSQGSKSTVRCASAHEPLSLSGPWLL